MVNYLHRKVELSNSKLSKNETSSSPQVPQTSPLPESFQAHPSIWSSLADQNINVSIHIDLVTNRCYNLSRSTIWNSWKGKSKHREPLSDKPAYRALVHESQGLCNQWPHLDLEYNSQLDKLDLLPKLQHIPTIRAWKRRIKNADDISCLPL